MLRKQMCSGYKFAYFYKTGKLKSFVSIYLQDVCHLLEITNYFIKFKIATSATTTITRLNTKFHKGIFGDILVLLLFHVINF